MTKHETLREAEQAEAIESLETELENLRTLLRVRRYGTLAGRSMDEIEREAVRQTLLLTDGHRKAAANALGVGERTFYRWLKKHGLDS